MIGSPSALRCTSVALPARYDRNRSGYATDSEIGWRYLEMGRDS